MGFVETLAQHFDGGVDFAALAFASMMISNDLPDVLDGFVVVAAVAEYVDEADDAPAFELAEAVGDVGSRDGEDGGDLFGVHGRR